jgi:Flp pilus assembly protein TadG
LSLIALIGAGGLAVDYAQLANLDTELQNAADQAALAAATQLDRETGAMERATAAARFLVANDTRFANDTGTDAATVATVTFYATAADAEAVTNEITSTASFANARFVRVTISARSARYALTPIVGLLQSNTIGAAAVAGMGSAICKTPPVMICNPAEATDPNFTVANYIGRGLRLVSVGGGPGAWSAGNFGYLDTNGGSNGVPGLQEALGWKAPPGECSATNGVDTKPGGNVPVTDALNTRFDIYDNGGCQNGGQCPPSINVVKDVMRGVGASGQNSCRLQNAGWQEPQQAAGQYLPNATNALTPTTLTPDIMGHPRDMCHAAVSAAADSCAGTPFGTGVWDRDAYFRTNYGWSATDWPTFTGLSATVPVTAANFASRYNVYRWEIENRGRTIGGTVVLASRTVSGQTDHDSPVCSALQTPSYGAGEIPGGSVVDRRRLSVAVVNCSNADGGSPVNGNSTDVTVNRWIEIFLVEPSFNRGASSSGTHARAGTNAGEIYVEVIGETRSGGAGATAGQVVRRDKPFLVQ